jgi:uncharacterized surface anchored protein
VPDLSENVYIISEVQAPAEYILDSVPQTVEVTSGKLSIAEFTNKPFPYLYIKKVDASTGALLAGAQFTIATQGGVIVANVTSIASGAVAIKVAPGVYTITEVKPPANYELNDPVQTVEVLANGSLVYYSGGSAVSGNIATFANKKLNSIEILKLDAVTKNPLANAIFNVTKANGENLGSFRTDASGKILLTGLSENVYVIGEVAAPFGFILNETPKSVNVSDGRLVVVEFLNKPLSGIQILKLDAITHKPLQGAAFSVTNANGERVGTYRTEADGTVLVAGLDEGVFLVGEIEPPIGYTLDEVPKAVTVKSGKLTTVEFTNKPLSGLQINKTDAITHAPLQGATFVIERDNGEKIGTYKTDVAGKIVVSGLSEGVYVAFESVQPVGYALDTTPQNIIVKSGKIATAEFTNKPLSGLQIIKTDAITHAPLQGATFVIERDNGEKIGTYKTDISGKIVVSGLSEGVYVAFESVQPVGYSLDTTPQNITVKSGKIATAEFTNAPLATLTIRKLNSVTRQPIAGVEFNVAKMTGEKVLTVHHSYNFKTDTNGQIYLTNLADGYYNITEVKQADGFILDSEPRTVLIKSGVPAVVEVLNTPLSSLLIVKTDEQTGKPLAGVVFDVKLVDGQLVAGSILDGNQPNTIANSPNKTTAPNGDISGSYTTDANGRILINGLLAGEYHVVERKQLDGYELDTNVHSVTVTPGKQATLQLTNTQKAGLRILKIDSISKKPIYDVEFMLFDENKKVVGTYYTDNNGVIDFSGILTEGRYTLRETRAAPNYYLDEIPKTVEFVRGKVTEIKWENTPKLGQIQLTKKSGDDNEVNGLSAGSPLSGAIFEVYDYKTGNLADRFVSGADGRAISKPLPLGRYFVKEVQSPQWYSNSIFCSRISGVHKPV